MSSVRHKILYGRCQSSDTHEYKTTIEQSDQAQLCKTLVSLLLLGFIMRVVDEFWRRYSKGDRTTKQNTHSAPVLNTQGSGGLCLPKLPVVR